MFKEKYELRVGLFSLMALIMLMYGWSWLKGFSPLDPPVVFWVRFHDVAGLANNATVNIQGVRCGTVEQISFKVPPGLKELPDGDPGKEGLPRVYLKVRVINHKMPIPKNAEITIQTLGLVGAKYIEITLPPGVDADHKEFIDPNEVVIGQDPIRVEMVINNIASKVNRAAEAISSEEAGSAMKDLAQAAAKLNKTMDKMPGVADSVKKASDNVARTSSQFGETAEQAKLVADNANKFLNQGTSTFGSVHTLATNLNKTNAKVGKILDNPELSRDLKETVELAHKTAKSISQTVSELSITVKDQNLRSDLIAMLSKLQSSSEDIRKSMQVVNQLAQDGELRQDVKVVVKDAREAMSKANDMLALPEFKTDIKQTIGKIHTAASDVDLAAKQLSQILRKRAPLLHMMFGKPGELEPEHEKLKDGTTVNANGVFH